MTQVAELKKRWMMEPEFRQEYEKADAEFAAIEASIRARSDADLTRARAIGRDRN